MINLFKYLRNSFGEIRYESHIAKYDRRRIVLEQNILHLKESGVSSEKYCDHDIIVSLTSYGKRLYEVAITIESLMEQTLKANRIVLWLQEDLKMVPIPANLQLLKKRGLEIYYCKDIRSYKKLIPSLETFPDDAIITVDDDLIYEYDFLEHLIVNHQRNQEIVFCYRLKEIGIDKKGNVLTYSKWKPMLHNDCRNSLRFLTTGGGVIFPPHCFDNEIFNEEVFGSICKYADDIWVNAMLLKSARIIQRIEYKHWDCFFVNEELQNEGLIQLNVFRNLNDKQFQSVYRKYDLLKKLQE